MGILTNPCPNPDCSARVNKRAQFCSKCGWAGPGSLIGCPACGKKVGGTSRFCWSCGSDLEKTKRPRIVGRRWVRDEEEFAVRVNASDVKGITKRVTVEPGSTAVIERNGRITKDVDWGTQTLDSILNVGRPSSIVLISTSDVVLRPSFTGLRDREGALVDVTVQAVMHVADIERFVQQYLPGGVSRVTLTTLEDRLGQELGYVVGALISKHSLPEMHGNMAWRDAFETELRDALSPTLSRHGLDLVQLSFVGFAGDNFETLQDDRGEVYMGNHAADHMAEKAAIRKRVLDLEAQGKLDEFKSTKDLDENIAEMESQYGLRSVLRDTEREETIEQARHEAELKRMLRGYEHEDLDREHGARVEDEELARAQELEKLVQTHEEDMKWAALVAVQKRVGTEEEFAREQERLRSNQDLAIAWKEAEQSRRNRLEEAKVREEERLADARAYAKAEEERLQAEAKRKDLEGQDKDRDAERQMRYEQHQQRMRALDRELELREFQMGLDYKLEKTRIKTDGEARVAESDYRVDAEVNKARFEEQDKRLADKDNAIERQQQNMDRALGSVESVVDKFTRGGGQPNVVIAGPGGAKQPGSQQQGQTAPCPNCNRPVPLEFPNCPYCKHSIVKA